MLGILLRIFFTSFYLLQGMQRRMKSFEELLLI
jgi:hypothetical protein